MNSWQEKEITRIQKGKKKVKLSLFAADMNLYLNILKTLPKNSGLINTFGKVGYKINKKPVAFLDTNNEQNEKEIRKSIPFTIASKKN
jgi:hypothetical protein